MSEIVLMLATFLHYILDIIQFALLAQVLIMFMFPNEDGLIISFISFITAPFIMAVEMVLEKAFPDNVSPSLPFVVTAMLVGFLNLLIISLI